MPLGVSNPQEQVFLLLFVPVPLDVGDASEQVFLLLFGTGVRGRSSLAGVSVTIGGVTTEAPYAGPQGGFVGLE